MDSEKSKPRDTLPTSSQQKNEPGFQDVNIGLASSTRTDLAIPNLNMPLPSSPSHFTENSIPQPYSQAMVLPDNDLTHVVSHFDGTQISAIDQNLLYDPISYFQSSNRNQTESHQISTPNSASYVSALWKHQIERGYITAKDNALECLPMYGQGGEANITSTGGIELTGSSTHHGGSIPVVGHTVSHREIGIDNRRMINAIPSSRDITHQTERNAHPDLSAYCNQKTDRSLLSPANMAQGFSSSQRSGVVSSSLMQNLGGSYGPYGLVHNADRFTQRPSLPYNDLQARGSTNTVLNSRSSSVSQMPQYDQHHGNLRSTGNLGLVENRNSQLSNIDPYRGIQSFQAMSSVPLSGSQAVIPNSGQLRFPDWPSYYSFMTGQTTQLASGQSQQQYARSVANFASEPYGVSPFVVCNAKQDQSVAGQQFPGYWGSATQTTEGALLEKRMKPPLAHQSFPVNKDSSARVTRDLLNIGVQPTGNLNQPQAINLVQDSKALHRPSGPVMPVANNNVPAQASSVRVRQSCKRGASWPTPATPEDQHRKARSRFSNTPSIPQLAQTLPSVRPPAQTPPPPLAHVTSLPPAAKSDPSVIIKGQVPDVAPETNEGKCLLCKRDLSYAPKGAFVRPAVAPVVGILPCGHCFHAECLNDITPASEAKDPPCIPCAMDES